MSLGSIFNSEEFDEKIIEEKNIRVLRSCLTQRNNIIQKHNKFKLNDQLIQGTPLIKSFSCIELASSSNIKTDSIPVISRNSKSVMNIDKIKNQNFTFYPQNLSVPNKIPRRDFMTLKESFSFPKNNKIIDRESLNETFKEISMLRKNKKHFQSQKDLAQNSNILIKNNLDTKYNFNVPKICKNSDKIFKKIYKGNTVNVFRRLYSSIPESIINAKRENHDSNRLKSPLHEKYSKKDHKKTEYFSFAPKIKSKSKYLQKKISIKKFEKQNIDKNQNISSPLSENTCSRINKMIKTLENSNNEDHVKFIKRFETQFIKCFPSNNTILFDLTQFSNIIQANFVQDFFV